MPLRGETIGTAYVRILADGGGFGDDVRDQLRDSESEFNEVGRDHGHAYAQGFNDEADKVLGEGSEDVHDAFQRGRGRWNAEGQIMGGAAGEGILDGIKEQIERDHGDVGLVVIKNLNEALQSGEIDYTGLTNRLANLRPELARATRQIVEDQKRMWGELGGAVDRYTQGIERGVGARRDLRNELVRLRQRMIQINGPSADLTARFRELHREISRATPMLTRFSNTIRGSGNVIGKAFGRGSRNDFINFFGGFMSILPRAGAAILGFAATAKAGLAGFVGDTRMRMAEGSNAVQAFIQTIGGAASTGLPGLVALAASVALAVTTLSVTLPALGAAVSLATGLILALAGSLGFALVGALGAVAGAMIPFAAALGVGALAISGITKEMKKTDGFKSMKKEWKELQTIAAEGIFGKDGSGFQAVSDILKGLEPIVKVVSDGLGDLLKQFGDFSKTKEFRDLMQDISAALKPMIPLLGRIGGKLLLSLANTFLALSPIIEDFLVWLDKALDSFIKFSTPPKGGGKSGLQKWFEDAWESAKIVGTTILEIIGLIGDLFSAGKGTGDDLFKSIGDQVKRIRDWLAENPDALKTWFEDAKALGEKLGQIVVHVVQFIDALDTPESRKTLMDILDIIDKIIQALIIAAGWLQDWLQIVGQIAGFWQQVGAAVGGLSDVFRAPFEGFLDWVRNVWWPDLLDIFQADSFGEFFDRILFAFGDLFRQIGDMFDAFMTEFTDWLGKLPAPMEVAVRALFGPWLWLYDVLVGHSLIPDLINEIIRLFGTLPGKIALALGGPLTGVFANWISGVLPTVQTSVNGIASAFSGLASKLFTKAGNAATAAGTWLSGLPGKAKTAAQGMADAFSGLAKKMIDKAGSIVSAVQTWASGAPSKAKATANSIADQFSGLAKKSMNEAGSLGAAVDSWGDSGVKEAHRVAQGIVNQFDGLNRQIKNAIGEVKITVKVVIPDIPRPHVTAIVDVPKSATGGVFNGAQVRMIGEAGPEAIVPLNRPLSQVDPAVRALSAFAQGLTPPNKADGGLGSSTTNDVNITVITPTKDPEAVAAEVFARMSAASYI